MNMLGCSERNASKKALIKAKRRTQQKTYLKEMEEVEEKVEEEKVEDEKVEETFARWRSSTEATMAMLNSEDLPGQNREEERQMQEKKRQNEEALRAELNTKQVEAQKKATDTRLNLS